MRPSPKHSFDSKSVSCVTKWGVSGLVDTIRSLFILKALGHQWLMPIILTTQEEEIRRIWFKTSLGK
jgi:hypothetical protein